jgi:hypothetical protein
MSLSPTTGTPQLSCSAYAGYVNTSIAGQFSGINGSYGPVSVTSYFDSQGNFVGLSVGVQPPSPIVGLSSADTNTATRPFIDYNAAGQALENLQNNLIDYNNMMTNLLP